MVIFRKDIGEILKSLFSFKYDENTSLAFKLVISAVPVSIVGFLLKDYIEDLFTGNTLYVGIALLFTAGLLLLTHFRQPEGRPVSYWQAIVIGLSQAVAIFPGVSRSGTTIATALLIGVDKAKAARFSFLMALIPILGAAFLETLDYIGNPAEASAISGLSLASGFIAAFLTGLFACQLMIRIVKRGKLTWFALYCAIVGVIAIASTFIG
jgi:undecaprenyl-diphosphatase